VGATDSGTSTLPFCQGFPYNPYFLFYSWPQNQSASVPCFGVTPPWRQHWESIYIPNECEWLKCCHLTVIESICKIRESPLHVATIRRNHSVDVLLSFSAVLNVLEVICTCTFLLYGQNGVGNLQNNCVFGVLLIYFRRCVGHMQCKYLYFPVALEDILTSHGSLSCGITSGRLSPKGGY